MADTKISAAADIATLVTTDMVPVARSGDSSAYHATMSEVATFVASKAGGVTSWNTRTGAVALTTGDVTTALGYTPYNTTNPAGYQTATDVTTALVPYAPLASPTFTGTPTLPTGAVAVTQTKGNNTTALATTAFVLANAGAGTAVTVSDTPPASPTSGQQWWDSVSGQMFIWYVDANSSQWVVANNGGVTPPAASSTTPSMDGTAAVGTGTTYARADHVHPSDTSRAPLAAPVFTGDARAVTPAAGDNDTSIATTAFVQTAVATAFSNAGRNRLHNSGFRIYQRGYVSGTALAAGAYAHDRWKAGAGGCTYTFTQTLQIPTTITITAGTLQQIVETLDVEGGSYMLSWTGTAQGRINAGSYAASPVAVTSLAANTAITVEFNTGTLGSVQLEPGTVATQFERISMQPELAKCQRFYQTGHAGMYGYGLAGAQFYYLISLPVLMRAAPTVNAGATTGTNMTGVGATQINADGFFMGGNVTAAGSCNFNNIFTASADL